MERTIDIPWEVEIPLPRGAGTVRVPFGKLPKEILQQLVVHGCRQKIADAYAGVKQVDPGIAQAIVDGWVEGRWARRGGGSAVADPFAAERKAVVAAAQAFCRRHPRPGVKVADRVAQAVKAWFDPSDPRHQGVKEVLGPAVAAILDTGRGDWEEAAL